MSFDFPDLDVEMDVSGLGSLPFSSLNSASLGYEMGLSGLEDLPFSDSLPDPFLRNFHSTRSTVPT